MLVPTGLLLVLALVLGATASAAARGDLVRNRAVGIRTRATLSTDRAWAAAHRAGAPWLRRAAGTAWAGAVACAVVALASGGRVPDGVVALLAGGALAAVVVLLVRSGRVADRAARAAAGAEPSADAGRTGGAGSS